MSTTTTATSTKVRFDDIGFDVAAEVLHHVDNVVDHLALSGVSQFWRKVVQNSSASGKTLLLREGVAKKLAELFILKRLALSGGTFFPTELKSWKMMSEGGGNRAIPNNQSL